MAVYFANYTFAPAAGLEYAFPVGSLTPGDKPRGRRVVLYAVDGAVEVYLATGSAGAKWSLASGEKEGFNGCDGQTLYVVGTDTKKIQIREEPLL